MIEPYKDLQEVFDKAYIGMAKQGFVQSMNGGGTSCACAEKQAQWNHLFQNIPFETLQVLQDCHDGFAVAPDVMKQRFIDFAEHHKLTVPAL